MSQIHSDENSATNMDHGSSDPPNSTRNGLLHFIVDDQITLVAPHRTEGDNHGGDDHTAFLITFEGGGLGIHPEAIVDDMLAVLPAPARHHILPDCCGEDFHFAI